MVVVPLLVGGGDFTAVGVLLFLCRVLSKLIGLPILYYQYYY